MTPGIHLVHKAVGETSFSLVQAFMEEIRAAGIRRDKLPVCHGGALDPFAEGLVLLLAGQATRLMDLLHPVPKTYSATIAWGAETDNGDLLGRVVARGEPQGLTADRLTGALAEFVGWREQVPPATSNKRIDGERAYRKAHRGERVELPPRASTCTRRAGYRIGCRSRAHSFSSQVAATTCAPWRGISAA